MAGAAPARSMEWNGFGSTCHWMSLASSPDVGRSSSNWLSSKELYINYNWIITSGVENCKQLYVCTSVHTAHRSHWLSGGPQVVGMYANVKPLSRTLPVDAGRSHWWYLFIICRYGKNRTWILGEEGGNPPGKKACSKIGCTYALRQPQPDPARWHTETRMPAAMQSIPSLVCSLFMWIVQSRVVHKLHQLPLGNCIYRLPARDLKVESENGPFNFMFSWQYSCLML